MGAQIDNDNAKLPDNERKTGVIRFRAEPAMLDWLRKKGSKSTSKNAYDLLKMAYLAEIMGYENDNQN